MCFFNKCLTSNIPICKEERRRQLRLILYDLWTKHKYATFQLSYNIKPILILKLTFQAQNTFKHYITIIPSQNQAEDWPVHLIQESFCWVVFHDLFWNS
jgi:hypothetical protein